MSLSYLHGATSALNKKAAISDWNDAVSLARQEHKLKLIKPHIPRDDYGVKRIDTATCKLLQELGIEKEDAEELGFGCCYQWGKATKQLAILTKVCK